MGEKAMAQKVRTRGAFHHEAVWGGGARLIVPAGATSFDAFAS